MIGALPIAGIGYFMFANAANDAAGHSGIGGALSGLGELVGLGLMALAAIAFVAGAVVLACSARD